MTQSKSSFRSFLSGIYYSALTRVEDAKKRRYRKRHNPIGFFVEKVFRGCETIQIVKIGANDGVTGDPIARLFREHPAWKCLFVEPVPWIFQQLLKNYEGDPRFTFEQCAVGEEDGVMEFFALEEFPENEDLLPEYASLIGSNNRRHLQCMLGEERDGSIQRLEVPSLSFSGLFRKHELAKIDLLHIDTEGFDFVLLKAFDFSQMHPLVLIIEHLHMSDAERGEARQIFENEGYRVKQMEDDFVAFLPNR